MTDDLDAPKTGASAEPRGWWLEWQAGSERLRVELRTELRIGRSPSMDVVLDDPYASREHCIIRLVDGRPLVDARGSLNHIRVDEAQVESAHLDAGATFTVGRTPILVRLAAPGADTTWIMRDKSATLSLRRSTRELLDVDETVLIRFSSAECAAFAALAERHPDAADHAAIGHAVWGDYPYDQYQIHRLLQRIRDRLGERGDLVENVRGAGYRLREPVALI